MGEQASKGVMDRYFKRMGAGEDFSDCYTADVTWTTFDDGSEVRGAGPVRAYLVALRENMVDARTRRLIFADSAAYLEGDCADSRTGNINRLAYCVAYDVTGEKISAMRCYGAIAHLAP
jgi:ketosteroid isomerase-like protein